MHLKLSVFILFLILDTGVSGWSRSESSGSGFVLESGSGRRSGTGSASSGTPYGGGGGHNGDASGGGSGDNVDASAGGGGEANGGSSGGSYASNRDAVKGFRELSGTGGGGGGDNGDASGGGGGAANGGSSGGGGSNAPIGYAAKGAGESCLLAAWSLTFTLMYFA